VKGGSTGASGVGTTDSGQSSPLRPSCGSANAYGDPLPPIDRRAAELVVSGFHSCDGPVWFANMAALFFSDIDYAKTAPGGNEPASTVRALTPAGSVAEFILDSGSSGLAIAPDGQILAAAYDTRGLAKFDLVQRKRTDLPLTYLGKHFNSPHDVAVRSDGNIYLTDPTYNLGGRSAEIDVTGVYRVSPMGEVSLVDGTMDNPNGIAFAPDEHALYVGSEDGGGSVTKFEVALDGSVGAKEKFANIQHPGGMTIDCAGNLYVAAGFNGQVEVFNAVGMEIGAIGVGAPTTNVAFGGAEAKTLFITTGGASPAVFAMELTVPGFPY
jgi:gluconolactonase